MAALLPGITSAADLQPQERTIHSQPSWILANGDCSHFSARRGYADLVAVVADERAISVRRGRDRAGAA